MGCSGFAQERRLNQVSNKAFLHTVLLSKDCSRSPAYFSMRSQMSIVESDGPPSWSHDACMRYWGEYKIPVGRGGGGHGRREKIFLPPHPHAFNPISPTQGHFVLSPVSLASRDQDGSLSDSTIDIYVLTGK